MTYLFIFVAMTILDFIWAEYTKAVQGKRIWVASGLAVALFLIGGSVAISYVTDHWLLIPASLGSFCGTALAMRYGSK